jgi:hypothetical protein
MDHDDIQSWRAGSPPTPIDCIEKKADFSARPPTYPLDEPLVCWKCGSPEKGHCMDGSSIHHCSRDEAPPVRCQHNWIERKSGRCVMCRWQVEDGSG